MVEHVQDAVHVRCFSGNTLNAASTAWRYRLTTMIDYFALAVTHALIFVALLRLIGRDALDDDACDYGGSVADAERSATKARNRRDGRPTSRPAKRSDRDA